MHCYVFLEIVYRIKPFSEVAGGTEESLLGRGWNFKKGVFHSREMASITHGPEIFGLVPIRIFCLEK